MQNRELSDDEIPSTEQFLALCYNCKLTSQDLEEMNYGSLIDYINAYIDMKDTTKTEKPRQADQNDIEAFFG